MKIKNKRTYVPDEKVHLIWQCKCRDCSAGNPVQDISPDWLQDNGTPTCECGADMTYIMTEISE